MERQNTSFTFGIYTASACAYLDGRPTVGPPDDNKSIIKALDELQGTATDFLVRVYVGYQYEPEDGTCILLGDQVYNAISYLANGRKLDLVLSFQNENDPELIGWKKMIKKVVKDFGAHIAKIQVTEEANAALAPVDGNYEGVVDALVAGVVLAKEEANKQGLDIAIGFNAAPDMDADQLFWKKIANLASDDFYRSLDYVGLDCFPDVFRPVAEDEMEEALYHLLKLFKLTNLKTAGIPKETPLHITENGWPTNATRSEQKQSEVLEQVIRTIHRHRKEFNITHYELFGLRDANSREEDIMNRFGIMRDDYFPKPAFFTYKRLIAELTGILSK